MKQFNFFECFTTGVITQNFAIVLFYVSSTTINPDNMPQAGETANVMARAGAPVMETQNSFEDPNSDISPEITQSTALFHILMLFASLYSGMILTNWGSLSIKGVVVTEFASPVFGFAVKLAAQWISTLLFVWSLIAPSVCPDRDFS